MFFDQVTLFMAASISCIALAATLIAAWLAAPRDKFLITWAMGILLCGIGTSIYLMFSPLNFDVAGGIGFVIATVGFAFILAAAGQFREDRRYWLLPVLVGGVGALWIAISFASGLNGQGTIAFNVTAAVVLVATGRRYWQVRDEAPISLIGMSILYGVTAASFICCAAMVFLESPMAMPAPPDSWAEQFNAIAALAGITGIGAFSLALNQTRAARRHRHEAATDSLTGMTNRRALFDRFGGRALERMSAVVVFDLDHFKAINDTHGHNVGDETLRCFAATLSAAAQPDDVCSRIGGEEFVLVMRRTEPHQAVAVAEAVRARFSETKIVTGHGVLRPTVSAGVAFADADGQDFESVLLRADRGLYQAKAEGRDRVTAPRQVA